MESPGYTVTAEFRLDHDDGTYRWIELTATNLLEDADVGAILGCLRDVTERRAALEELRKSEARFHALSESGLIGIAITDRIGGVHDANDTFLSMTGYSRDDLAAGHVRWDKMTPPEFAAMSDVANAQLATHGFARAWEKEYIRKDGTRFACLVGVSAIDQTRNVMFVVDLTERKRIEKALHHSEEQLRQAQKMEAVGRLAGAVAHDFNNVLSVILSFSVLAQESIPGDAALHADIGEIRRAAERAADLTKQLLLFSRQEVLEMKVIDVNAVLMGMSRLIARLAGEDVKVVFDGATALWPVRADPGSIEQVIMNLAVNARDAMPGGGTLTIQTANVELDEAYARAHHGAKAGPHVMLAVRDTGIGMEEATQARIFEPFFTTKEVGKGTGLGLSTVFGIVQQSGGTISVESAPAKGSSFRVHLPRVHEAVDPEETSPHSSTFRGGETVLLVEDEDQLRSAAREILQRFGYRVLEAASGAAAVAIAAEYDGDIDLLLSDVVMPVMGGHELARDLAKSRPNMRVVCMSGYSDDSLTRRAELKGHYGFLQKPFTPESLCRKVRETIDFGAV